METYQPTSRRPIADVFRRTARAAVRWCIRRNVHPDAISYLSILWAAGAAACFWASSRWPWLLLVATPLMWLRLYFNMLDGMVALESGKASPRGEIVNELPDRISDVLIFAGVAHSGWANPFLAYWAAILALLTAYVGTLSQAVTGKRRFEGLMSKQWRMATLSIGALALLLTLWLRPDLTHPGGLRLLDWACLAVVVGCVQTCWVRLAHMVRDLSGRSDSKGESS